MRPMSTRRTMRGWRRKERMVGSTWTSCCLQRRQHMLWSLKHSCNLDRKAGTTPHGTVWRRVDSDLLPPSYKDPCDCIGPTGIILISKLLITSAKCLLSCQITESQVRIQNVGTNLPAVCWGRLLSPHLILRVCNTQLFVHSISIWASS